MPLPESWSDFWTLPAAILMVLPGFSGNFLSLQFASDTCHLYTSTLFKFLMGGVQGAGFLNQPGPLKLSGNIPQNCHAQLHSYHLLLYEKIPPPVHLRSLLHSFYQGIMVYHTWSHFCQFFIHLPCGPKNITCSLSPPLVNLLFRTPTATEGVANDGWVKRFMSSLSSGGCLRLTSLACQLSGPGGDAMEMMNRSRR